MKVSGETKMKRFKKTKWTMKNEKTKIQIKRD